MMIKLKYILIISIVSAIMYSCGKDDNTTENNFDHKAQAIKDNDSLVKFLKNHYYDVSSKTVKPMSTGKTALLDDSKLKTQQVTENEIDYKLYVYVDDLGVSSKGNPTVVDSVFVNYNGQRIENTKSISSSFDKGTNKWFMLTNVVKGWSYGLTNFKGGENATSNNGPISFINGGKGVLFIPSGLAYRNQESGNIQPNENLLFYIDLLDVVVDTDHDNDNVASIKEDVDQDGDVNNDDTDKDRIPNYLDTDDDGDGKLTKDEDVNGDGDPSNDFSDSDNPILPDYLNPNIK